MDKHIILPICFITLPFLFAGVVYYYIMALSVALGMDDKEDQQQTK